VRQGERPYEDVVAIWNAATGESITVQKARNIVTMAMEKIRRRLLRLHGDQEWA
jgi:hypothetical protein